MSFGFPPGLRAVPLPNAAPDEYRRLLQQAPYDPSQAAPVMSAGDRAGPGGASAPAVAMDEADTQRLEQATGMRPEGQAPRYSGIAEMFGGAPMGPAQSFSGTSGTIVPGSDAGLQGSPMPPARPSAADLAAPTAPAPLSFGGPPRRASPAPRADVPAPGAAPAMGQAPAGLTAPAVAAPAAAAAPGASAPAPEDPSFLDRMMKGIRDSDGLLTSVGAGLMSTPGFGAGIAAGLKSHETSSAQRAASKLAGAEFQIKQAKALREAKGENATKAWLTSRGLDDNLSTAAMSNTTVLQSVISQLTKDPSRVTIGGSIYELKPGEKPSEANLLGPAEAGADIVRARAQAQAEGAAAGKPAEPFNLPEGNTRYNADGTPMVTAPAKKPDGFDVETKLRGEFAKGLGSFQDVHDGYGRVIAATRQREANPEGVSPASDISLIFGYMKMLDPGSVVREGEYATAKNAAGLDDRMRNTYNRLLSGEFLTPEQRQDFLGQASELYGTARKGADAVAGRYRNLAGQYGVDPGRTAFLPEVPTAPVVGQDRMKPGGERGRPSAPAAPSRTDIEAEARRRGLMR